MVLASDQLCLCFWSFHFGWFSIWHPASGISSHIFDAGGSVPPVFPILVGVDTATLRYHCRRNDISVIPYDAMQVTAWSDRLETLVQPDSASIAAAGLHLTHVTCIRLPHAGRPKTARPSSFHFSANRPVETFTTVGLRYLTCYYVSLLYCRQGGYLINFVHYPRLHARYFGTPGNLRTNPSTYPTTTTISPRFFELPSVKK